MSPSKNSPQTFSLKVKVKSKDSAFLYFILESNEGLCFYSTLDYTHHDPYRIIHIQGHFKFQQSVENILDQLRKNFPIELVDMN